MPKVSEVTQDSAINVNKSKVDATSLAVADESAAISEQIETLDHQLLDKPLARMQEEKSAALHEAMDHAKSDNVAPTATAASIGKTEETAATEDGSIKSPQSAKEMPAPNPPLASTTDVAESDIVSDSSDSDISSDSDTEDATVSAPTANDDQGKETRKIAVASSPLTSGRSSDMEGEGSQIPPEEEAVLHDDDNELERVLDVGLT